MVFFLISSVSAADLDGNDFIQADLDSDLNADVIALQESDSANPIDDSLALADSDDNIQDSSNDNIVNSIEADEGNDILNDVETDDVDDNDDEEENPRKHQISNGLF